MILLFERMVRLFFEKTVNRFINDGLLLSTQLKFSLNSLERVSFKSVVKNTFSFIILFFSIFMKFDRNFVCTYFDMLKNMASFHVKDVQLSSVQEHQFKLQRCGRIV